MHTLMKIGIHGTMAAMLLTLALAGPVVAKDNLHFDGFFQGAEVDLVQGATLLVDGSGTGLATHLGQFQITWNVVVNLANGSATGFGQLIAANGDSISTTIRGQGDATEPGLNSIVEINDITDGTGQFAGATGRFTVERLLNPATGFTSGSVSGKIKTQD